MDLRNEKKVHHQGDGFASFIMRTHAKYSPIGLTWRGYSKARQLE
jgi:hypothetical protein